MLPLQSKPHARTKDSTKHISLRVPDHVVLALESDSARLGIPVNSVTNSVLKRWANWDRHMRTLETVMVPKQMIHMLISNTDEKSIYDLADGIFPFFQELVILMKGKYDLKRCIETLEDYMQTTGMISDHKVEGQVHIFTVRHRMGRYWSVFIKAVLRRLFTEFVPDRKIEYEMQENIISVRVQLGSDWDEHDY